MPRPRTPISSHGTITVVEVEAGKKWRARTRFRFDDGRLRQVERFDTTRAKAETKLKRAMTELRASGVGELRRETRLRELGKRYLEATSDRAPRTVEYYRHSVDRVIMPAIGDLAIAEATPERLQRFLDVVARDRGSGAARAARAVLSGMMGLAARSDAVRHNPVRELAPVRGKSAGADAIPLADLPALLEAVRGDQRMRDMDMVDLVSFMAGTGVRISEACGLHWEDVDLGAGTITVRDSKTAAGRRRLRVPGAVTGMLGDRRVRGGPNDEGMVFPTVMGKRRDPRGAAREWAAARERLGMPGEWSFHAFRKTVATALDQAGLSPRDVAEYLGHADPAITMSTYMSKTVGGRRAADALDSVLSE